MQVYSSKVQRFEIQYKLPSLNEVTRQNRTHWSIGYRSKRSIEQIIGWAILQARIKPVVSYPVIINITYYEPNKRRDIDNIESSQKFILDALQKYNILKNDNPKYVAQINKRVEYGVKQHKVIVEIVEVE